MHSQVFVLCLLLCGVPFVQPVVLPPSFKVCPRNSPDLASCVKSSIEFLRPQLKTGDFGNGFLVDSIEPIKIDDIVIDRGDGFYVNLFNLNAKGASNFKINKMRVNPENFKVDAIVDVPQIEAYGNYKLKMKLGVLDLAGNGNMRAYLDNLKLKLSLAGSTYTKNGAEYVRIDKSTVRIKIVQLKLNFENLFKGDRVLNDLGNSLVNENIDLFIKDIEPILERSLAKQFLSSANQVFSKAPLNVFLP